jgi:hypothetical protein
MLKIEWRDSHHQIPPEILKMIPKSGAFSATLFIFKRNTTMKLTAFNKVYDLELDVLHYFN